MLWLFASFLKQVAASQGRAGQSHPAVLCSRLQNCLTGSREQPWGRPWGRRKECASLSVHIPEKFLSFAIMNSVPSFKRACEIFICSLEHKIFKGQFLSCLLSRETWFRDSLEGDQIVGLCVNAPSSQREMGCGVGEGRTESFVLTFLEISPELHLSIWALPPMIVFQGTRSLRGDNYPLQLPREALSKDLAV